MCGHACSCISVTANIGVVGKGRGEDGTKIEIEEESSDDSLRWLEIQFLFITVCRKARTIAMTVMAV